MAIPDTAIGGITKYRHRGGSAFKESGYWDESLIGASYKPMPNDSPLAAAEAQFLRAFRNADWDEERVREGCRLAWEAARGAMVRVDAPRMWRIETLSDFKAAIYRLDEIDKRGGRDGGRPFIPQYMAVKAFYERAALEDDDYGQLMYRDARQFIYGLGSVQSLIASLDELSHDAAISA